MAYGSESPNHSAASPPPSRAGRAKAKPKPKAAGGAGKGKYQWDGGARVHSISQKTHEQRVEANRMLGGQDLTAPPSASQAITEANSAADLQYGPQIAAAKQLQANIAPWFGDYLARVAGYAQAAQTLNAPVLGQAQAYQTGAATQTAPGLDPNSEAGKQAAQAAAGRGALAQLGLDALNTNATATQNYFGGQQAMAARQQPQAQAAANQGVADAQSQRGAAVQGFLTTARQNAQNYAIARGTLNLNADKAVADATSDAASTAETVRHNTASEQNATDRTNASTQAAADRTAQAGAKPNKYGIPASQWDHWSTSHRQRIIDAFNEKHAAGADDKAAAKHATDVSTATGSLQNTVSDIVSTWDTYERSGTADDTTKPQDPKTKQYPQRKLTTDELRGAVGKKNKAWTPQLIHIALLRRAGKKLDQASIDYLHNLDPNIRIPRDWLPYDPSVKPGSSQDPKPTSGQSGGIGGK